MSRRRFYQTQRLVTAMASGLAVLALSACSDNRVEVSTTSEIETETGVLRVVQSLTCPDTVGSLVRKGSATSDGTVCVYGGSRGSEVTLHLVSLDEQSASTSLRSFEDQLGALMPETLQRIAEADPPSGDAVARVGTESDTSSSGDTEAVSISGPAMKIEAQGDKATVQMPGIHIDADGDKADIRIGGLSISASGDNARIDGSAGGQSLQIQTRDEATRMLTSSNGEATRQSFLITDGRPGNTGWRTVGYEARGPRGGPIVVATVKSRTEDDDDIIDDARALITLNVGK